MIIGYARVSTSDQNTALQTAHCERLYQEAGSGSTRARPELARRLEAPRVRGRKGAGRANWMRARSGKREPC